jgi:hypothetical protein
MKVPKQISKVRKYLTRSMESISSHAIFKNKYMLYFAALLAGLRLLDYIVKLQYVNVFYYLLTALTVYFFTSNLTVVYLVTFLTTTLLLCNSGREGLENKDDAVPEKKAKPVVKAQLVSPSDKDSADGVPETLPVAESLQNKNTDTKKKNSRLDYASTIEDSYKMLDKMLSKEGIRNLNTDTQSLIQQQAKLGKMMEGMKPLMDSAKDLLKNFNPTQSS